MDVFEYAMKMELDGEAFYRENLSRVSDENVARFIDRLAKEERKHYETVKQFKAGAGTPPKSEFAGAAKNIFERMKAEGQSFADADTGTMDVLRGGLEIEDKSVKFYASELEKDPDSPNAPVLRFLKKEEDRHYSTIAAIIEFYEKPETWNEQAEFNYLDEEY